MLTYIISRTVPKLLQIIGQICAFDRGTYHSLTHSGLTPKLRITQFGLKKLEKFLYHVGQNAFRYLEPFRRSLRV